MVVSLRERGAMNKTFFDCHLKDLFEILDRSSISEAEKQYRKRDLNRCVTRIAQLEKSEDYDRYNELAHEIESYAFLSQFGSVRMAEDCKHQPGCDLVLNNSIYVECVCSTAGDAEKSGLASYMGPGSFDYRKKSQLLNERFINSLSNKVEFYNTHKNQSISPDMPYIIFLSPGSLIYDWFTETHGMALLDVLLGRGNPTILVNTETGEMRDGGYSHKTSMSKHNGSPLNCNLFMEPSFNCVSAIFLSTRLGVRYSKENTFLFLNPFALQPINEDVFKDIVVWKSTDGVKYAAYLGGEQLAI